MRRGARAGSGDTRRPGLGIRSARRRWSRSRTRAGSASGSGIPPPRGPPESRGRTRSLPPPPPPSPSSSPGDHDDVVSLRKNSTSSTQTRINPSRCRPANSATSLTSAGMRSGYRARYHPPPFMAASDTTSLQVERREPERARATRCRRPHGPGPIVHYGGGDESPGVKEGGTLEQVTRELNIEALPTNTPDTIEHDVSAMEMNDTLTLSAITAPEGVTLLDDLEETVVATLSPPRVEEEPEEEIEEETELVGEEGEVPEGEGEAPAEGVEEA